jgi:hypothetical protein
MRTERKPHLENITTDRPAYAATLDFGGDTAAKNQYYLMQFLPPLMEIYTILQEIKSQYPSSE